MKKTLIILLLIQYSNLVLSQSDCVQISQKDLYVGDEQMDHHISTEFMKRSSSLSEGGVMGIFWVKLTFNSEGDVQKMDVSSGATPAITQFFIDELRAVKLNCDNKKLPTVFNVVIPVRFWIHTRRSSETKKVAHDQMSLLSFFSGTQNSKTNCYFFMPELLITGPIH